MTILAFIFVLGVLVFVHETGHFVVARWYGVRVITFSLGFGPKLLKFTSGDTEYAISVIPLGGYVKMAGETVEETLSGAPDEFMSKSKWIRFQVYLAGPVMNLALAVVVLTFALMGGADIPVADGGPPIIGEVAAGSPAERAGLRAGDLVLQVNGRAVPSWEMLQMEILPAPNRELDLAVRRDGQEIQLAVTPDSEGRYEMGTVGISPVKRPQILQVNPDTAASRAGLMRGDVIVAFDGVTNLAQPQIIERIQQSEGRLLAMTIERGDEILDLSVAPDFDGTDSLLGVLIREEEFRRIEPGFVEAVNMSIDQNWANTVLIGRTLKGLFTRETPVRQLMGPVAIAELSGTYAQLGWQALFSFMAMISLNLGLLNLMPVPVLDGGHIMILAVEGASRRDLSVRVKERVLLVGAAMIILLMVTVIYNDVARLLR
jgi:regulator of sigma E protease